MLIFKFYSISHYRSLVAVKRKTASVLGATDTVFDDYEEKKHVVYLNRLTLLTLIRYKDKTNI